LKIYFCAIHNLYDLLWQLRAQCAAGCEAIQAEIRSGTTTQGRDELRIVLDFLRPGDVLMVMVSITLPAASGTFKT
jgi:hypothetical protein